ncbi:MAG: hypothetical protein ACRD22_01755 [Terriglobia bacterium]
MTFTVSINAMTEGSMKVEWDGAEFTVFGSSAVCPSIPEEKAADFLKSKSLRLYLPATITPLRTELKIGLIKAGYVRSVWSKKLWQNGGQRPPLQPSAKFNGCSA